MATLQMNIQQPANGNPVPQNFMVSGWVDPFENVTLSAWIVMPNGTRVNGGVAPTANGWNIPLTFPGGGTGAFYNLTVRATKTCALTGLTHSVTDQITVQY